MVLLLGKLGGKLDKEEIVSAVACYLVACKRKGEHFQRPTPYPCILHIMLKYCLRVLVMM